MLHWGKIQIRINEIIVIPPKTYRPTPIIFRIISKHMISIAMEPIKQFLYLFA